MVPVVNNVHSRYGFPDEVFEQRAPLVGQITKKEIRAVSIHSLGLRPDSVLWDIGSGSGSVAIESSHIVTSGIVYAIEKDIKSIDILRNNVDNYGFGNVEIVVGEAPEVLDNLEDPDSIFVGGSGGSLKGILELSRTRIKPGGRIVVNLALLERTQKVYDDMKALGFSSELVMINASRSKEMLEGSLRLQALNPVFIVTGTLN